MKLVKKGKEFKEVHPVDLQGWLDNGFQLVDSTHEDRGPHAFNLNRDKNNLDAPGITYDDYQVVKEGMTKKFFKDGKLAGEIQITEN